MQWDSGVLPERSDPEFQACLNHMVSEAMGRDEDALVSDEYPEFVKVIVRSSRWMKRKWDEHDARLEEQQTVCATPGCQCDRRYDQMFRKFAYGMDTDDSESEDIADRNERLYEMEWPL